MSFGWQAINKKLFILRSLAKAKEDGWQAMYYTYILQSKTNVSELYMGHTSNIKERLAKHNSGKSAHTAKFRPWKLKLYIAFERLEQAKNFERYLKSGSGHAFANKHFWA